MGRSPEAHLFWGYDYLNDGQDPDSKEYVEEDEDGDREDWDDKLLRLTGIPKHENPEFTEDLKAIATEHVKSNRRIMPGERMGWWDLPRDNPEFVKYMAGVKAWQEAKKAKLAEYGCEIFTHGCDGCENQAVAISASRFNEEWGPAQELDPGALVVGEDWPEKLRAFCELMGIKHRTPGWHLAAS